MLELAPGIMFHVIPPSGLVYHCTLGGGLPVALAVTMNGSPMEASVEFGCSTTIGPYKTVKRLLFETVEPTSFV